MIATFHPRYGLDEETRKKIHAITLKYREPDMRGKTQSCEVFRCVTAEQIERIREMRFREDKSLGIIAEATGLAVATVSRICRAQSPRPCERGAFKSLASSAL